ncbi:MAG TPA: DinB family protein [Terriglobales bacterium]|nr:DinB family protein [Terriglobales bacterium]
MTHRLDDTIALLARTPAALNALLRDLPDSWTRRNEGEKTWSAYDIVGHLIHGEKTDWIPRARRILHSGESVPFDKFDREAQFRDSEGKTLPALLDEFARLRAENLALLRGMKLQPADLAKRGMHPALGSVTLSELLAGWPVHDLTHLHQLSRVMAHQYRDSIGPWPRYMGVLQCSGHSE